MPKRTSKEVKEVKEVKAAITTLFEEIFYETMIAMVKAEPYESEYGGFSEAARNLTKTQLRQISKDAAEYYVREVGPSPGKVSRERVSMLKKKAIAYALERLTADETRD
jgi:hypothetical protein